MWPTATGPGNLCRVDPTTGATTWIGSTDVDSSFYGLAFVPAGIFSDGFESGDTSAWSNAVPEPGGPWPVLETSWRGRSVPLRGFNTSRIASRSLVRRSLAAQRRARNASTILAEEMDRGDEFAASGFSLDDREQLKYLVYNTLRRTPSLARALQ